MRTKIGLGLSLALLCLPLAVGYMTAPCDTFGAPVVLAPYRLHQERYLVQATRWTNAVAAVGATLDSLAAAPAPQSTSAAFRLAEQVGQAASRLEALTLPPAPAEYSLLALTLEQTRDTYAYAAEQLLAFYGNQDPQALAEAQTSLDLAAAALADAQAGIAGLTYPLCREVWHDRP